MTARTFHLVPHGAAASQTAKPQSSCCRGDDALRLTTSRSSPSSSPSSPSPSLLLDSPCCCSSTPSFLSIPTWLATTYLSSWYTNANANGNRPYPHSTRRTKQWQHQFQQQQQQSHFFFCSKEMDGTTLWMRHAVLPWCWIGSLVMALIVGYYHGQHHSLNGSSAIAFGHFGPSSLGCWVTNAATGNSLHDNHNNDQLSTGLHMWYCPNQNNISSNDPSWRLIHVYAGPVYNASISSTEMNGSSLTNHGTSFLPPPPPLPHPLAAAGKNRRHRVSVHSNQTVVESTFWNQSILSFVKDHQHHQYPLWYGQASQDALVAALFRYQQRGYFVDLAANDATIYSNTYSLERFFQWSGICIEPNDQYWTNLTLQRPVCHVVGAVVGRTRNEAISFRFEAGDHGGISGNGFNNGKRWQSRSHTRYTVPLQDILNRFHAPSVIDYLSLDVEGAESFLLLPFPFDQPYRFKVITAERLRGEIRLHLKQHGYQFIQRLTKWGESLWIHSSAMTELDLSALDQFEFPI